MIVEEYPYNENENLIRHYSDREWDIKQIETGNIYGEAIDKYPCAFTYEEVEPEPVEEVIE